MKVTVLFFGILKDIVKSNSIELEIQNDTLINSLKAQLLKDYVKLNAFNNFSIAVNEEYVASDCMLYDNDVVALIPPVSGG